MSCSVCSVILQLCLNLAQWLDVTGNTILLGSPGETISHRTARAREAGKTWAKYACSVLSVMFWFMHRDHCDWALGSDQIEKEIWHWSK